MHFPPKTYITTRIHELVLRNTKTASMIEYDDVDMFETSLGSAFILTCYEIQTMLLWG
jgi:hypothetical protein